MTRSICDSCLRAGDEGEYGYDGYGNSFIPDEDDDLCPGCDCSHDICECGPNEFPEREDFGYFGEMGLWD